MRRLWEPQIVIKHCLRFFSSTTKVYLLFGRWFRRHHICDQPLLPVEFGPQLSRDLAQLVSFFAQSRDLALSRPQHGFQIRDLLLIRRCSVLWLVLQFIFDLGHHGIHIYSHLLNPVSKRFILLLEALRATLHHLRQIPWLSIWKHHGFVVTLHEFFL